MASVSCLDFLGKKKRGEPPGMIAVHGDSDFLRREARLAIRSWIVGDEASDFAYSSYEGDSAGPGAMDELYTPPFLGERRLVVIEQADDFVSKNRPTLEKIAREPSSVGTLLLDVRTWAATTKLAQAAPLAIQCSTPKDHLAAGWVEKWSEHRHGKRIDHATAGKLVDATGNELGLIDQELAKLSTFVGGRESITADDVAKLVVGKGDENVFKVLDLALDGRLPDSLRELDRALSAGEHPVKLMAIVSGQLRKFGEAARRAVMKIPLDVALREAGIPPFAVAEAERRLKRLGRERAADLYRESLAADFAIKGGAEVSPRVVLERMLTWLATGVH
jgi:DNA polymerase-3 subunit delta